MNVRAKFRVHNISGQQVSMSPVYSSDPATENYSWSQATPSGQIQMHISNPAALEQFEVNKEYLVTFAPAE